MSPSFGRSSAPLPSPVPAPVKVDPKKQERERWRSILLDKIEKLKAQLVSAQNSLDPRRSVIEGLKGEIEDLEAQVAEISSLL
jgi:peptidoglycan hydrolase CwlO-like protein